MELRKPNIIYINSPDTGRYTQPYGHAVDTPNLQRLAEEGVLFRQSFTVAPTCSPSRAALTLGQLPRTSGIFGLGHRGFIPNDFSQHLAQTLKDAGYLTIAEKRMPDNHTGAKFIGNGPEDAHRVCGYEQRFRDDADIIDTIKRDHERPFFMSINHVVTHRKGAGFTAKPDARDDPRYTAPPPVLADTPEVRADWAHFKSDARLLDEKIGEVITAVDEAGLRENTLIIATTDHGAPFPGMKCCLNVQGCGTFLIIRGPGGFTGGKVVDALCSNLDIYPTVCELLEIKKPDFLQGASLLPLISGETEEIHEFITGEVTYHAAYEPKRCYREKRWVYARRFGERKKVVMPNIDASPSKTVWIHDGYADSESDWETLYDAFYDPQEMNNLAYHPKYQAKLEEMRGKLNQQMQSVNDPLLSGDVPAPKGAKVTDPDAMDP